MDYVTKYQIIFKNRINQAITVNIKQDGFSGTATGVQAAADPLQIEWPGDRDDIYKPVKGSQAIIKFIAESDGQFNEFFDAKNKEYLIEILIGASKFWTGYIMIGDYYESLGAAPYEVTISAYDIGYLQYEKWDRDNFTSGTIMATIATIMESAAPFVGFYEMVNIYEDSISDGTGDSPFTQIDISHYSFLDENFVGLSLYEVLERILRPFGVVMLQHYNRWWLMRIPDRIGAHRYRSFTTAGVYSFGGSTDRTELFDDYKSAFGRSVLMALPVYKDLNMTYDLGVKNLVLNADPVNTELTPSDFWTYVSGMGSIFFTDYVKTTLQGMYDFPCIRILSNNSTRYKTNHTKTYGVYADTSFTFKYGYALYNNSYASGYGGVNYAASTLRVEVKLTGTSTYYLDLSDGSWSTTSTVSDLVFTSTSNKDWEDFTVITEPTPIEGTLSFSVTAADWTDGFGGTVEHNTYFRISCFPEMMSDVFIPLTASIYEEIEADNLENGPDVTLYYGDAVDVDGADIYFGALTLNSDGTATGTWTPKNSGGRSAGLLDLLVDSYKAMYEKPARRIQTTLYSTSETGGDVYVVEQWKDSDGRYYFPLTVTHDLKEASLSGEWGEIQIGYGDDLVTAYTEGSSPYDFDSFTDNGDGTVRFFFDNTGGAATEKRVYLNQITTDATYFYEVSIVSVFDHVGAPSYGYTASIEWDSESEAIDIAEGDKVYFQGVDPNVTPYLKINVAVNDMIDYTVQISVKKIYGV